MDFTIPIEDIDKSLINDEKNRIYVIYFLMQRNKRGLDIGEFDEIFFTI